MSVQQSNIYKIIVTDKKKDVNIIAIGKVWRKKNKKIGGERRMTQEDIVILSQLLDQKFEPVYTLSLIHILLYLDHFLESIINVHRLIRSVMLII